jgi:4-amino-4-deoxy-L-arabinose transferase-like glycosyltransferase
MHMSSIELEGRHPGFWKEMGVLIAILAVAAFFRFTQLHTVPPGMTHDEAAFGAEAELILAGERPIYFSLGYGHEPLYAYLVAVTFSLFGHTLAVMRATSAMCGLLFVLLAYLLARRMFGFHVAWISAAWMAVSFWALTPSRQALRGETLPVVWMLAAWWFWRGLQVERRKLKVAGRKAEDTSSKARLATCNLQPSTFNFALAGLFLGISFYTYLASRVTWVVFPVFALYLLLSKENRVMLRRIWPGVAMMLAVAGLIALPLALYLRANPGIEVRMDGMMEPIREFLRGRPQRLWRHIWNALRVFSWVGDTFWAYNIPGRPIFNGVGSILFYAGLALALWHWRDARYAFLVLWLPITMLPAFVTTNEGIFVRSFVAQPATYMLVGVALEGGRRAVLRKWPKGRQWIQAGWVTLAAGLAIVEGARTWQAYFVDWPTRPETRNIYNHNMVAIAKLLDKEPESGAVGISALYPLYYHDPWILRYVSGRDDLDVRWFDGRGGMVYPAEGEARYVFSALTPLDPALRAEFEARAALIERHELAPDDQNPYFEIWRWRGRDALEAQLGAQRAASPMWISPEVHFAQPELRRALAEPAQFGDVMALIAYRLNGQTFKPGDVIELVTYWRALRTVKGEDDWDTFVHLLDRESQIVGGSDVLHCPPTGWRPGDVAVQVHRFPVAADAPQGQEAFLEIGVYRHRAGRLPVLIDGTTAGDRVLLTPVEIQ